MPSRRTFAVYLLCFLALIGCGASTVVVTTPATSTPAPTSAPAATATPAAANLTTVDWANFTYHNSCIFSPATTPSPAMVTVHNGEYPFPNNDKYVVYTPIYGDITGDGQPEVVIPNDCIGGQPRGKEFDVYTGTAASPQYMGHLPLPTDPQPDISIGDPSKVSFGGSHTLILGGAGYSSASIPVCCPDLSITDTFTWQSNHFVLTNQKHTP